MNKEIAKAKWSIYIQRKMLESNSETYEQIGEYLGGFSPSLVWKWVNEKGFPSFKSICKLKKRFPNDDFDWLFE